MPASVSSEHDEGTAVEAALMRRLVEGIAQAGGWWSFERFMQAALYEPGLGYYASGRRIFGTMPAQGSDFVTAPELSPLFGKVMARQLMQAFEAGVPRRVWEFGAGSGAWAASMLEALDVAGVSLESYTIVDVSGSLQAMQRARLTPTWGNRVRWIDTLPAAFDGVVLGNEVLDAMPVRRLRFDGARWWEQGVVVVWRDGLAHLAPEDRACDLRPDLEAEEEAALPAGTLTEVHHQAEAFTATVAQRLGARSLALWVDYGFPQAEYYHPQRVGGTVMCHRAHRADDNPFVDVGAKDITAHVNFTGIALAAQAAGAEVYGYTSQGRFLLNAGLVPLMAASSLAAQNAAHRLVAEHEMGELFKVLAYGRGLSDVPWIGFVTGDRTHRL